MSKILQIQNFYWFRNREKGKMCLLAGTAPTIDSFPFDKFKGVYITMGDGPVRLRRYFKPNYWISSNSIFPIPEVHFKLINKLVDTVFVFSDSVAYSDKPYSINSIREKIHVPWFAFDQRHFHNKYCEPRRKCCDLVDLYPDRLTLQEYLQKEYSTESHYGAGSTVAMHALAFAILMGCRPIFIQGVELPSNVSAHKYSKDLRADLLLLKLEGSFIKKIKFIIKNILSRMGFFNKVSDFGVAREEIIKDFIYLSHLAKKNNQQLYILSPTSLLASLPGFELVSKEEAEKIMINHKS